MLDKHIKLLCLLKSFLVCDLQTLCVLPVVILLIKQTTEIHVHYMQLNAI